jgi:glyoxylase-like metal-dependent hydrolase (beta-lactamase superfamily II)
MYQVYALKYGERQTTACNFFFRETSHAPLTLHFYVWLILGGPHPVLVDTGFTEEDATQRGIVNFVSPATMVERLGVKAAEVPIALVSHLHWDHWAGHSLFPAAAFWIQQEEIAFWTGPIARYDAYKMFASPPSLGALVRMNYANRVHAVQGECEVLPGLRVHWLGGHTAGLQIVTVETARGRIVLTSDAAHFYRNVERYQPSQLFTSLPQMLQGFDTIHALAGDRSRIVTGHDPEVAERFKQLSPGIVQIA